MFLHTKYCIITFSPYGIPTIKKTAREVHKTGNYFLFSRTNKNDKNVKFLMMMIQLKKELCFLFFE